MPRTPFDQLEDQFTFIRDFVFNINEDVRLLKI